MLAPLLEREYRRLGPEYIPRAIFVQGQLLYPVVFVGVLLVSAYVPMSTGLYLRLAFLGCALQFVYTFVSTREVRRLARPVAAWLDEREDPDRACDAWEAASSLPLTFVRRTFSRSWLGVSLWDLYALWVGYFTWQLDLALTTGLLVYAGVVVLILYALALRYFGVEQTVRPVL